MSWSAIWYLLSNYCKISQELPHIYHFSNSIIDLGCARIRMVILLLLTIYPHYYSWWMFINYYNDEYFAQYWHQVFFFVTELCSTGFVLSSVNRELPFTQRKLLMIVRFVSLITKNKWICQRLFSKKTKLN